MPKPTSVISFQLRSRSSVATHLLIDAFRLLAMFARELSAEVLRFEHLANLDLSLFALHGVRTAFDPIDCLLQRLALQEPESGNQFLCLGEWAVNHRPFLSG